MTAGQIQLLAGLLLILSGVAILVWIKRHPGTPLIPSANGDRLLPYRWGQWCGRLGIPVRTLFGAGICC